MCYLSASNYNKWALAVNLCEVLCTKISLKKSNISEVCTVCPHAYVHLLLFSVNIYRVICMSPCLINMLVYWLLDNVAVLSITPQFTAYEAYCFTTHTRAHTNMLTCSSVTRKTATGCGLGTKTFSELSEDARSQDAPSQNVKDFRCQNRQAQALIWGEMMLKQHCRWRLTKTLCLILTTT